MATTKPALFEFDVGCFASSLPKFLLLLYHFERAKIHVSRVDSTKQTNQDKMRAFS
jgi:hypothetical protein